MQFDYYQHLRIEDPREKPHGETIAIHLGSEYESSYPRLEGNHDFWVKMCHLCRV
jgi:hypothetical protein